MARYQVATTVLPPEGLSLEECGVQLARALIFSELLPIERGASHYVIRAGSPSSVVAQLPLNLTEPLDNEYAARAAWAVTRIYPREHGQVRVVLKRTAPRHGFVSTYQNDGCRCPDCTAANAEATFEYRRRVSPPTEKAPRKHGAQCWKYGCHCEERKAADRLRQSRRRARIASEKSSSSESSQPNVPEPAPTARSNVRVLVDEATAAQTSETQELGFSV